MARTNADYVVAIIHVDGFPWPDLNGVFVMSDRTLDGCSVFGTIPPQYILYFQWAQQRWAIADKVVLSAIIQGEYPGIACEETGGISSEIHPAAGNHVWLYYIQNKWKPFEIKVSLRSSEFTIQKLGSQRDDDPMAENETGRDFLKLVIYEPAWVETSGCSKEVVKRPKKKKLGRKERLRAKRAANAIAHIRNVSISEEWF